MLASVNRMASERPPAFLTLTYPREYPDDPTIYRAHARAFLKRLRRNYGDRPVIWRLEFQQRGAPHFHMLVWDLKTSPETTDWLRDAWFDVVGSGDDRHARHGIDLQPLADWRRVAVYLSKYIAKPCDDEGEVLEPTGRWWGVESRALLPIHPVSFVASVAAGVKIRRAMHRLHRRRSPGGLGDAGASAFIGDDPATRLFLFYGARFERPPPHQPDQDELPAAPAPSVGDAWRAQRHAYIARNLSFSCRLK